METKSQLQVPESLTTQIREYRSVVRIRKIAEAMGIAVTAVLVGFAVVFATDRFLDSTPWFRALVWIASMVGVAMLPFAWRRWVLKLRTLESVAKLLSKKLPAVGDSLLGALELSANAQEQNRSPVLCQAALEQVAKDTSKRNLLHSLPASKHRGWCSAAMAGLAMTGGLAVAFPQATLNAWQRFLLPLASIERFTFTSLESLPKKLVVPYGEDFNVSLRLAAGTQWTPRNARAQVGRLPDIEVGHQEGIYDFEIPAQLQSTSLNFAVGDASPSMEVIPSMRPELESLSATIQLPAYLQIPETFAKDIRGGALTIVRGASLQFRSRTTKEIASATANSKSLPVKEGSFVLPSFEVSEPTRIELEWRDTDGLQAKAPFPLMIQSIEDEQPAVFGDGLPKARVVLETEQIQFTVRSLDDFGIRHVGLEWKTIESSPSIPDEKGEFMLAKGSPTSQSLDAIATFQATAMKIPSRPVEVRLFTEDYLPERGRMYSSPHLLYVLNPNDHAVWMLDQITKWQRESLEVRDRELQLLAANKQIRDLSVEELNQEETRTRIEQQASAELSNGRRLNNLTAKGEELLRQAARNPEIGVGHLEKWAEMQKILKDIASNRMPSVADLLKQAATSKQLAKNSPNGPANDSKFSPTAGKIQPSETPPANGESEPQPPSANASAPSVVDQESSQQPVDPNQLASNSKPKKSGPAALRLPSTTLMGTAGKGEDAEQEEEEEQNEVEQAVNKQEELLAEFQKVADELNELMGNLEGSTLVKRLKAASREQGEIADSTGSELSDAFGISSQRMKSEQLARVKDLSGRETKAVDFVSLIVDDMQGFHDRRPSEKFEGVLAEIKKEDVVGGLRRLSDTIVEHQGLAIAEAEFWSDTLDRWAEDIVDPAGKGECKGSKSKSSLPPSIVLEVMQVLEEEMNLRDRTRVAEQSKAASSNEEYMDKVDELANTQISLQERIIVVKKKIIALPDSEAEFEKEIGLMGEVSAVMLDAATLLDSPDTGAKAVAAETEAIELLLKSKRVNPKKSSGGGGSDPGGGGGGTTDEAAIAMIGPGMNQQEQRQDHGVSQQTGTSGASLPEEFRYGLDEYFQRIDRKNLRQ